MEHELEQDGTLTVYVAPLPSTIASGEYTDCFVTDELPATRELMRSLLAEGVERLQVRVDLTKLTEGYMGVCDEHAPDAAREARTTARYLMRAGNRLLNWADRVCEG